MEEYWQQKMPAVTSVIEHQDVVMDAWQMIVTNFNAEMVDGKETFGQNPTQQSVKEEYSIYVMGALSDGSMVDTLGFWKVGIYHNRLSMFKLLNCRQAHEHTFPTIFRIAIDYLPIQASAVPCEQVFSSSAETNTKKRNRIRPELMEAIQVLKFALKKSCLDFMAHLQLPGDSMVGDVSDSNNTLTEMLKMNSGALQGFLQTLSF
jgi:hAT family C-terminal dimerisation region